MSAATKELLAGRNRKLASKGMATSSADAALDNYMEGGWKSYEEAKKARAERKAEIEKFNSHLDQGWGKKKMKADEIQKLISTFSAASTDGMVDVGDASTLINDLGLENIANEALASMDVDEDGKISLEEFVAWFFSHDVRHAARCNEMAADAFARFDTNNDGSIDNGEFVKACRELKAGNGYKLWHLMDLDSDGQMSLLEFKAFYFRYCKRMVEAQVEAELELEHQAKMTNAAYAQAYEVGMANNYTAKKAEVMTFENQFYGADKTKPVLPSAAVAVEPAGHTSMLLVVAGVALGLGAAAVAMLRK